MQAREIFYKQTEKHRRRCRVCWKRIEDGAPTVQERFQVERCYPVKGIMRFAQAHFYHRGCYLANLFFVGKS